jgi:mitogen-activated protein kinase kinase 5
MTAIEIHFQLGRECRLAILESDDLLTFDSLLRLTERTFSKCKHPFTSFIYVDDDGDRVTVSSELEMGPLRDFYFRLCQQQISSKPILKLETIVNRNHANLTIDTLSTSYPVDHHQQKKFSNLEANVEHILSTGTMLSLDMLEIIGTGNSGVVRRCRNRKTQQILAVKIISLDFQKDEKKHEIVTELNALNTLHSDYIVLLHGAYLHENSVHICTEYMDRGSLEQYIGLLVPESVLVHITLSMIHGLAYMWSRKIMHRDIKPSNVLVNSSGSIKLCDFGVSRVLETIGQKLATFIGTHKYMAPERVISDEYSIPSEIWSLGMTILEMGLAKYPFQTENHHPPIAVRPIELVQCIVYETPPLLPTNRGYSPEFASLIQQCLSKNSAERPLAMSFFENPLLMKYNTNDTNQSQAIIADFFNRTTIATATT